MKYKIDIGLIKKRLMLTYYVRCAVCGYTILDLDDAKVVERANAQGFRYDSETNDFICGDCLKRKVKI